MKIDRLDLGKIIREKVEKSGMSKAKFAERVGIARQNIEKTVFQKHSLDTNLLCQISEVLDCNIFNYFKCNTDDDGRKELRATLTIEMGAEKHDRVMHFVFGENNIEILNK